MNNYVNCKSAKDASAKVITYWSNLRKDVTYFGDPDKAEDCYKHKTESRMFQFGAWTRVDYKIKEGNKWI